jgi:hypothetical protein
MAHTLESSTPTRNRRHVVQWWIREDGSRYRTVLRVLEAGVRELPVNDTLTVCAVKL